MALLFMDGFDHYLDLDKKWDSQFFGNVIVATQAEGRFTPGALQVKGTGGGGTRTKNLKSSTEVIAGFAWNNINSDAFRGLFNFTDNNGNEAQLIINIATGVATLTFNGQTATTASTTFTGAVWQHVEIRVKVSDTVGELEIRRNGVQVAQVTGVDTQPASFTGLVSFSVEADDNSQLHFVDDLYILDTTGSVNNTFAGDSRIVTLLPASAGTSDDFTPTGAGSNHAATNETLIDDDTTFVESGLFGAKDAYTMQTLLSKGLIPTTIFGLQIANGSKKTDAGRIDYLDQMVIGGTTFDNGVDIVSTSGAYKFTTFIRDTDPSDSGTWTIAKVDAVQAGIEITFTE